MTGRISRLAAGTGAGSIQVDGGLNVSFDLSTVVAYDVAKLAVGQRVTFDLNSATPPAAVNILVPISPQANLCGQQRRTPAGGSRSTGFEHLPKNSPTSQIVAVLVVSPLEADHDCLRAIFSHSNWKIFRVHDCREAFDFLSRHVLAVLVCERDLPDGSWKTLLESLSTRPVPPLVVVTARNADENLWAEVLELGAYDVLSKPFDRAEVTKIISLAWLRWKEQATSSIQKPAGARQTV